MGFMTIDGRKVEFTDEKNVLSVIRNCLSLMYRRRRQREDFCLLL